ncbi:MAG: hypothetical protein ACOCP8_03525 [archaeon]
MNNTPEKRYKTWEKELHSRAETSKQRIQIFSQIYINDKEYEKLLKNIIPVFNDLEKLRNFSLSYSLLYCRFLVEATHREYNPYSGKLWSNLTKELERTGYSFSRNKSNPYFYPEVGDFFLQNLTKLRKRYSALEKPEGVHNKYVASLLVHSGIPAKCINPLLSNLSLQKGFGILDKIDHTYLKEQIKYMQRISKYSKEFLINHPLGIKLVKQLIRLYFRAKKEKIGAPSVLGQLKILPPMIREVKKFVAGSKVQKKQVKINRNSKIEKKLEFNPEKRELIINLNIPKKLNIIKLELSCENKILKEKKLENKSNYEHQKILLEEPKYLKGSIKFYKKNNNCLNKPILDSGIDLILFSEEGYFQNIEDKIQPGLYWLLIDRKYVNNHENFKHMFDIREKKNFSQLGWMRKYNIFLIHINTDFDLYINNKDYSISISKSNYNLSELLYFTGKRLYCEVLHNRILSRIPVFSGETPPVLKVADNIKGEYIGVVKYLNNETWRDITSENADLEVNTENGYTYFDLQGKFIKNIKKMNSPLLLKYSLESYDLTGERIEKHVLWLPGLKIYQPCGILQKEVNPQSKLIFPNQVKVESQNGNLEEKEENIYYHYLSEDKREGNLIIKYKGQLTYHFQLLWEAKGNLQISTASLKNEYIDNNDSITLTPAVFDDLDAAIDIFSWPLLKGKLIIPDVIDKNIKINKNGYFTLSFYDFGNRIKRAWNKKKINLPKLHFEAFNNKYYLMTFMYQIRNEISSDLSKKILSMLEEFLLFQGKKINKDRYQINRNYLFIENMFSILDKKLSSNYIYWYEELKEIYYYIKSQQEIIKGPYGEELVKVFSQNNFNLKEKYHGR